MALLRLLCAALLSAGMLVVSTAAQAGDSPENQQARYRDAHRAMARKDWLTARDLLRTLWADSPTYDVASSLAQVEYQLGELPMAATHLAFALEHVAPMEKPETLERMRRGMQELRSKVGGLQLSATRPSAVVTLDGRSLSPDELARELFVEPGPHVIEARAEGAGPARQALDVVPGQTYRVELELLPLPTPPARALPGPAAPPPDAPRAEASQSWWPVLVGGSLAAVGVGVAVGFGLEANGAEADWRHRRDALPPSGCAAAMTSSCAKLKDAIERQHRAATWSNIGIGVSVLSVAATTAYLLFWPNEVGSERTRLAPTFTVHSQAAQLSLAGDF